MQIPEMVQCSPYTVVQMIYRDTLILRKNNTVLGQSTILPLHPVHALPARYRQATFNGEKVEQNRENCQEMKRPGSHRKN